jgi:hypothetical protein
MRRMTTQDHSSHADRVVATFRDGDAARRASLAIERLGIDSSRVHVDAKADLTSHTAESRVDSASMQRPRHRAVVGAIVGGIVGAAIGLVLGLVMDVIPTGAALALFTIPGVIIGALFGLYSRLETSSDISDTAAGGPVKLTVDLTALDGAEREAAVAKLRAEQPLRLAES